MICRLTGQAFRNSLYGWHILRENEYLLTLGIVVAIDRNIIVPLLSCVP